MDDKTKPDMELPEPSRSKSDPKGDVNRDTGTGGNRDAGSTSDKRPSARAQLNAFTAQRQKSMSAKVKKKDITKTKGAKEHGRF